MFTSRGGIERSLIVGPKATLCFDIPFAPVIHYGLQADQRTGLFIEAAVSGAVLRTDDVNDGLTSMNYRRPPKFSGK